MHSYEYVATGNGISVLNGGVKTAVINQDGTLNGSAVIDDASITAAKLASNAVETAKIKDANVTLGKLAAGITPSHVVKYAGTATWSGSGATLAHTVTGVAATDIVMATVKVKATEASYLVSAVPSTNTITFELSAANTTNDAQISYMVLRAAA